MNDAIKYAGLTILAAGAGVAACVFAPDLMTTVMAKVTDKQKELLHRDIARGTETKGNLDDKRDIR